MTRITPISLGVLCLACALNVHDTNAGTTVTSLVVQDNNVSGGGFQSDVTITDDGLTLYSSADVSGVFKSTNGGLSFRSVSEGLRSPQVASLAITPDNEQVLYIGTGNQGSSGGLFRSTDGGDTWALTGDGELAQFSGNHSRSSDPVPDGHPRSNGDLIVIDIGNDPSTYTDDTVIVGTYEDGVMIFEQGGEQLISSVNTSGFVRSVAYHPVLENTAYAAIQFSDTSKNGIYKIDYSNSSQPISTLEYATPRPEGLTVLGSGHVYGAVGSAGIVRFNGSNWRVLGQGTLAIGEDGEGGEPNRQWTSVTGYFRESINSDVVYAGVNNLGPEYSSIWRSTDGGSSWTALVDVDTNVSDQIHGQSYDWWYRVDAFNQGGLGRRNSVVSSIDVARGNFLNGVLDDVVYVSGRGGIWKSENGGGLWEPAVFNMQATSNRGVAVNPNDSKQVVLGNTDYVVLETGNRFEGSDVSRDRPLNSESRGHDVIFDQISDELILGVGDRDRNNPGGGEVYVKPAELVGGNRSDWVNLNIQSATNDNNGRVRAVAYGYHDGTTKTSQTILAVVEGEPENRGVPEGVYRYHNGTWTRSVGISIRNTLRSNFVWPDSENSGVVYLLDLLVGLYRSSDGGQSWTNIWPSMMFNNADFFSTGYIAADDNDPTTLYLSVQGRAGSPIRTNFKVYRLSGADTETFADPTIDNSGITDISQHSVDIDIRRPGPIAFGPDGNLWLTEQQNSANSVVAGLFVMENPRTDTSFKDVTTNEYRNIAIRPSGIAVSSDKHVYVSQFGAGVVKMQYSTSDTNSEFCFPIENKQGELTVVCL